MNDGARSKDVEYGAGGSNEILIGDGVEGFTSPLQINGQARHKTLQQPLQRPLSLTDIKKPNLPKNPVKKHFTICRAGRRYSRLISEITFRGCWIVQEYIVKLHFMNIFFNRDELYYE